MAKNPWKFIWSAMMTAVWFRNSRGIADDNLYYIVQGGLNRLARAISLWDARRQLRRKIFNADGGTPQDAVVAVAIGGLAWDEPRPAMYRMVEFCVARLPHTKPRHLLGVCKPVDILECIERGIDSFDGIAATREGRHGRVWTRGGKYFDIQKAQYAEDQRVLEVGCDCPACAAGMVRADLRARFKAKEREAIRLLMAHNWHHNYRLVRGARQAIFEGRFQAFKQAYLNTV